MARWITLQETADKIGLRKGTLCMWRNRRKFPFKTKGKARNLQVDSLSVDEWLKEHKDDVLQGRNRPRKPLAKKKGRPVRKVRRKAVRKVGRRRGRKVGTARKAGAILVKGSLDLAAVQHLVADIKAGCHVQVALTGDGYALTTVKG